MPLLGRGGGQTAAPPAEAIHAELQAATTASTPTLTPQQSGTTNRLQAVSPVNDQVVWASGVGGTYTVTTDGGQTWRAGVVPGAEALQFRDVEGQSDKVAYLLAAGPGEQSRIYRTEDGGQHWSLQFENHDPNAFYDCFAFWHGQRAITMSDAVNGRFPVIRTSDGRRWNSIAERLPAAQDGEAAFAASGTCVATQGGDLAWIGTGGATKARILATLDGGNTWKAYDTPIVQGTPSSGVITVAFRDRTHGILGGGELARPDDFADNVA
ncbi:MAG: oxidoreductase, partial [Gemmatimonadetes bacterium]